MNLELKHDGGGSRHYLEGKPIHCGTQLLLRVNPIHSDQERWVWARYEAHWGRGDPMPVLHTTFGRVVPDEGTFLRWPKEEER